MAPRSPPPPVVLHPYRKRKFFFELAKLLGEDPPTVTPSPLRRTASSSVAAAATGRQERDDTDGLHVDSAAVGSLFADNTNNQRLSLSTEDEENSFDCIQFDGSLGSNSYPPPSQSSLFGSMQDSACLVPLNARVERADMESLPAFAASLTSSADADCQFSVSTPLRSSRRRRRTCNADANTARRCSPSGTKRADTTTRIVCSSTTATCTAPVRATELIACSAADAAAVVATNHDELVDYFDNDRMCELTPCWLHGQRAQCRVHTDTITCPMLLFCLHVMDEFIACNAQEPREQWRVALCALARCVFVARWDAHVLDGSVRHEIALSDHVARKTAIAGVAFEVWRIVDAFWDAHHARYVHHETLHLGDAQVSQPSCVWTATRAFLHVFGLRRSQAGRLACAVSTSSTVLSAIDIVATTEQSELFATAPHDSVLRFGVAHYRQLQADSSSGSSSSESSQLPIERHVVSQREWRVAVKAIEIHLHKWDAGAQVFPCGAFSRGAAFGSTIDLLVQLPNAHASLTTRRPRTSSCPTMRRTRQATQQYDDVVEALVSAKIVQRSTEHRVAPTRSLFAVPFKRVRLVLDFKVYAPPQSWFALVYFTGPQSFVRAFFASLLKRPLRDVSSNDSDNGVSFDAVYTAAIDVHGWAAVAAVESEESVFALAGCEYVAPSARV